MGIHRSALVVAWLALAALALPACGGGSDAGTAAADVPATDAPTADTPAPAEAGKPVARIVFVDQEECCECTAKRIDGTWAALQLALEGNDGIPVERIHGDTQEAQAKPFTDMRPLMVAPGVYFLDADGALVEMLQGELTESQIAAQLTVNAS